MDVKILLRKETVLSICSVFYGLNFEAIFITVYREKMRYTDYLLS